MIERTAYLQRLREWKDMGVIKVVTGIRRCGKSTLLKQYQSVLIEEGISPSQIISVNFEDMDFEKLLDYHELYRFLTERMLPDRKNYIFLDEIQNVMGYENVVDSLFLKENVDIYITGSSSYLFSGQLATKLRGRYIEIPMLPFSFQEFFQTQNESAETAFTKYMKAGGFPYIHAMDIQENQMDMYLEGIYNTVLLRDIEERLNRKINEKDQSRSATDVLLLKSIAKYLSSVIGSPISIRGITNYLISNERKVSPTTVSEYMSALCDSYLYYPVERIDISGKELLKSNKKYYIVDLGLRNYILPKKNYDLGFTIENIVYFELIRRGYEVNTGHYQNTEVDFVARKNNQYTYFQVSATLMDPSTFEREIRPLKMISDNYEKIILTLDRFTLGNYEGIVVVNLIDWLLGI